MCKYFELLSVCSLDGKPFVSKGVQIHATNVDVAGQLRIQDKKCKDENRSIKKKIFRCVDILIKQKWAATKNTETLVKFVASFGVKELEEHISTSEVKYLSSDGVIDMINWLSVLLEKDLLEDLRNQDLALLADESMDIAPRSQMRSIMARFVSENRPIQTYFLGFAQLTKMDAETMCVIETFLVSKDISVDQICLLDLMAVTS